MSGRRDDAWHVYLITCVAPGDLGKQYIGITRRHPYARFGWHFSQAPKKATPLALAIQKHGDFAFEFEVLVCCTSKRDALYCEQVLIDQFGTRIPDGFNVGGRGSKLRADHAEKVRAYNRQPEIKRRHVRDMHRYWTDEKRAEHGEKIRNRARDPEYQKANRAQLDAARVRRRRGAGARLGNATSYTTDPRQGDLL